MLNKEIEAALKTLEKQIAEISDMLKEVSHDIIDGGFSNYPIFVAHQENAKIGEMILDRTEFDFPLSINATVMERLIELNILNQNIVLILNCNSQWLWMEKQHMYHLIQKEIVLKEWKET